MLDLKLEPFAVRLHWQLTREGGEADWSQLLGEFVELLAKRCDNAGKCIIGHIKGFATLPDGGYVRVNAVSARMPADVDVKSRGRFTRLTLTLNVLVYGHSCDLLKRLTEEAADEVAAKFGAIVNFM